MTVLPSASSPKSGTRRSPSCSPVSPRPAATSAIFSWARTFSALNGTRWAMPCRCISATSLPIAASTSSPSTARWCAPSPGHARSTGVSLRTVVSSPNQPSACSAQLSFAGIPASRHCSNRPQAKAASESCVHAEASTSTPG
jgi:hypothetical protein